MRGSGAHPQLEKNKPYSVDSGKVANRSNKLTRLGASRLLGTTLITCLNLCPNLCSCYRCCCPRRGYCRRRRRRRHLHPHSANFDPLPFLLSPWTAVPLRTPNRHKPGRVDTPGDSGPEGFPPPCEEAHTTSTWPATRTKSRYLYCN